MAWSMLPLFPKQKNPTHQPEPGLYVPTLGDWQPDSPMVSTERNIRTSWALSCFLLQLGGAQSSRKEHGPKALKHTSILVMGRQVFYKQYQQSAHLTLQNRAWQGRHIQESCTNATLWDMIKTSSKKEYLWELHISVSHVVTSAFWCPGIKAQPQAQCLLLAGGTWAGHT